MAGSLGNNRYRLRRMAGLWTSSWQMGGCLGGEDGQGAEQRGDRGRTLGALAWLSQRPLPLVLPTLAHSSKVLSRVGLHSLGTVGD